MSFEKKVENIKETGRKRLIQILKLLIEEIPRLERGFFSADHQLQRKTQVEVLYVVDLIEDELEALAFEEKKPSYQVWQEIFQPHHFTVKELEVLKKGMEIFKQNSQKLVKPRAKNALRSRGEKV